MCFNNDVAPLNLTSALSSISLVFVFFSHQAADSLLGIMEIPQVVRGKVGKLGQAWRSGRQKTLTPFCRHVTLAPCWPYARYLAPAGFARRPHSRVADGRRSTSETTSRLPYTIAELSSTAFNMGRGEPLP